MERAEAHPPSYAFFFCCCVYLGCELSLDVSCADGMTGKQAGIEISAVPFFRRAFQVYDTLDTPLPLAAASSTRASPPPNHAPNDRFCHITEEMEETTPLPPAPSSCPRVHTRHSLDPTPPCRKRAPCERDSCPTQIR